MICGCVGGRCIIVLCTEGFAIGPDKRFGAGVDWAKVKILE